MGRIFLKHLDNASQIFGCESCGVHLFESADILVPIETHTRTIFEVRCAHNIQKGPEREKIPFTGLCLTRDIFCICCQNPLGWQYVKAFNPLEMYKEGRYILEHVKNVFR